MKVSQNWVKEFTDIQLSVDELVEKIGSQLGAVEEVIDLGEKYKGIVIAKVVSCVDHPDSDHLHVCKIDDGGKIHNVERDENGNVQVVCGAPNVREGLTVAWLPPGTTVPESVGKEPFVLEVRAIRGQVSNGMLASAKELAISDDHDGILELGAAEEKPGEDFAQAFKLDDVIIDIENKMFTHRPDCFGELGVAREIAGISGKAFTSPDWYKISNSIHTSSSEHITGFGVTVEVPELCPRYMLIGVDNITVGPSPLWLQSYLSRVGIRPINNVVDITNYMMVLTGQPLHAFDFDKVAENGNAQIVVRKPHEGETITLLDGKTITPRADAVLITAKDAPIALGGVMGGNNSEIDNGTTRILIECANFDMYNIRRTSMEHGIFTDAVTRFNKGQSEWQCPPVLYKTVQLMQEICEGAKPIGEVVDFHKPLRENQTISVSVEVVNSRLGLQLSAAEMKQLLENVEFIVSAESDTVKVQAPFWRTDIEIPEDVVEEIGRLYGFDKLPLELPRRSITPAKKDELLELKSRVRQTLSAAGANEVLTYSFVHGNLLDKVGQDKSNAFQLSNALSPDLQYYRLSLIPSLLEKVHPNIKSGYDEFVLFELGKAHVLHEPDPHEPEVPKEVNALSAVYASRTAETNGAAFYIARKYLLELLKVFGATQTVRFEPLDGADLYDNPWLIAMTAPFEPSRSAVLSDANGLVWGVVGEFTAACNRSLKLPPAAAGFELDPLLLLKGQASNYTPLPRFPEVTQDMTLKVPIELRHGELENFLRNELGERKPSETAASLETIDIFQSETDETHRNVTFRLKIASYEKTMTDAEVNKLLDEIAAAAKEKFEAERV